MKPNFNDTFPIELQFQLGEDTDNIEMVNVVADITNRRKLINITWPEDRFVDRDLGMPILHLRLIVRTPTTKEQKV